MINFFSTEGKLYRLGTILGDLVLIGLLWTIFSLPIVTIGATTTALYYVCTKKSAGKDDYIFRGFIKSFKGNFTKATLLFLILILMSFMAWINLYVLGQVDMGWLTSPIRIALYFVLLQVVFVATHVFCILSRFETTVFGALKSALFMAYRHVFITLSNLVLLITILFISVWFPVLIIFMMGIYVYLSSFLFVKMFREHYPDFDKSVDTTLEVFSL